MTLAKEQRYAVGVRGSTMLDVMPLDAKIRGFRISGSRYYEGLRNLHAVRQPRDPYSHRRTSSPLSSKHSRVEGSGTTSAVTLPLSMGEPLLSMRCERRAKNFAHTSAERSGGCS